MKIFIESVELDEIKEIEKLGIIAGVAINRCEKEDRELKFMIEDIHELGNLQIIVELKSTKASEMVREAMDLNKIASNIIVSIPIGDKGLRAIKELNKLDIRTNVTEVKSIVQGVFAKLVGATYITISANKTKGNLCTLIENISSIYKSEDYSPDIILKDVGKNIDVEKIIRDECNIITLTYSNIKEFME